MPCYKIGTENVMLLLWFLSVNNYRTVPSYLLYDTHIILKLYGKIIPFSINNSTKNIGCRGKGVKTKVTNIKNTNSSPFPLTYEPECYTLSLKIHQDVIYLDL